MVVFRHGVETSVSQSSDSSSRSSPVVVYILDVPFERTHEEHRADFVCVCQKNIEQHLH